MKRRSTRLMTDAAIGPLASHCSICCYFWISSLQINNRNVYIQYIGTQKKIILPLYVLLLEDRCCIFSAPEAKTSCEIEEHCY